MAKPLSRDAMMDKLAVWINDEQQTIAYSWLARQLVISAAEAKECVHFRVRGLSFH